jgi:hypothetical protein
MKFIKVNKGRIVNILSETFKFFIIIFEYFSSTSTYVSQQSVVLENIFVDFTLVFSFFCDLF